MAANFYGSQCGYLCAWCFNPSSNGIWPRTENQRMKRNMPTSFNPSSNGIWPRTSDRLLLHVPCGSVSILLLMEYGREPAVSRQVGSRNYVSILLLMEYGREPAASMPKPSSNWGFNPSSNGIWPRTVDYIQNLAAWIVFQSFF